jgi:hypothetical protein
MNRLGRRIILLALVVSLSGCYGRGNYENANCALLRQYSKAEQEKLADEIDSATESAIFPEFILDYATLRQQIRASCGIVNPLYSHTVADQWSRLRSCIYIHSAQARLERLGLKIKGIYYIGASAKFSLIIA